MNTFLKILFFMFFGIIFIPETSVAQEFTVLETEEEKEKKKEEKYLKFQTYFFEALLQKSKEDYNKAIESLDDCKSIYPDNVALNFEYAKNYLKLKDFDNAIFFSEKALEKKPNNLYILEQLKNAYKLQYDYKNAILIQKRLVSLKPSKENGLVYLYIKNNQKDKARISFLKLEKLGLLDLRKSYFERVLFPNRNKKRIIKSPSKKEIINNEVSKSPEKIKFKKDNSFKSLIKLLEKEEQLNQFDLLVKDSKKGLDLFPAQPKLYLINSKAQNTLKKYKKALETLELGLDFIVDDNNMLVNFYEQMKIAYLGLNQSANATKYENKALTLRKAN